MIERAGDGEPALHAARERVDPVVAPVAELHELEQLVGPFADHAPREVEVAAVDEEVVAHGELEVERVLLGHDAEAGADARAVGRPGRGRAPRSSPSETGETHPIMRMVEVLPAPFGPEEAERLARLDVEVDAVDRDERRRSAS